MADKYHRLICFVVDICCEPLRKLFNKRAQADTLHAFSNLCGYLSQRKSQICKLRLRHDQYQLLFPANGVPDENKWDVTLLVTLITNLFQVQPLIACALGEIRTIRNELQHIGSTSDMSNDEFEGYWMRLETSTLTLARDVSSGKYEDDIRKKIDQTRNSNMPNLADCLIKFLEENGKEMRQEQCVMKEEMKRLTTNTEEINTNMISVAANTIQTTSKLRKVCVTKKGPTGEKTKRLKTVDEILCRLIKRFFATMKTELPGNVTPPAEIADVRTKLRDSHHVIIAGSGNSINLVTALFTINELEYNHNRCVEMTDASEWRHIDPEDVDLVLCRDPFGKPLYDARKASSMVDIFDSIHHAVRPRDGSKHLDFIIVTDVDCLTALKATRDHDLLEEVVLLSTSENQPIDLTSASYKLLEQFGQKLDFTRYITQTILDNYSTYTADIDPAKLEQARELLRRHRMVAITGPPNSGKTSTVVALAQAYTFTAVLFLRSPDDIRNIDPRTTFLVVIEDFGGKYLFDKMEVNKWFGVLDCLSKLVNAGKLQVIVTGETARLQNCIRDIAPHPLLLNQVILTRGQMHLPIKQEPSQKCCVLDENKSEQFSNNMRTSLTQDPRTTNTLHTGRGISASWIPYMDNYTTLGHVTATSLTQDPRTTHALHTGRGISASWIPYMDTPGHVTANTPALNLTMTSALHEKRGISTSLIPSKDSTKKSGQVTGSVFWENNAGLQLPIANVPSLQVVRSVQSVRQYRVWVGSDKVSCYIWGCCMLPGGEILLVYYWNNRLKKLDSAYNVISVCDLPDGPRGVCYIGNNVAVVCGYYKLVYVDVSSMTVRNTVTTDHWCYSITCHNDKLYVMSDDTVYIYTLDGNNKSTLYKLQYSSFSITGIAVSGDGNRIYITDENTGLITIDNFGNLLNSLTLVDACAVCVDDRGNVWVCGMFNKKLYQVSSDGARRLGTVSVDKVNITLALCYDRDRSSLIMAGELNDNIHVVQLD